MWVNVDEPKESDWLRKPLAPIKENQSPTHTQSHSWTLTHTYLHLPIVTYTHPYSHTLTHTSIFANFFKLCKKKGENFFYWKNVVWVVIVECRRVWVTVGECQWVWVSVYECRWVRMSVHECSWVCVSLGRTLDFTKKVETLWDIFTPPSLSKIIYARVLTSLFNWYDFWIIAEAPRFMYYRWFS